MAAAPVVVDTSIAVKWYLPEKGSEEASRLRMEWERAGAPIMMPELVHKALELAIEMDATVYDCIYLALAIFADARLITADAQFAKKAEKYPVELLR
jgi:predicted nucleic acid-binding protein